MKGMFCLSAAAIIFAGCSSTEVRAPVSLQRSEGARYADASEVRKLQEEARENFARLRGDQANPNRPQRTIARVEPVGSSGGLRDSRDSEDPSISTETIYAAPAAYQNRPLRPIADEDAVERARESAERRWQLQQRANSYRVWEAGYARQLGKKPSQLTPEERAWVRDNFE